MTKDLTPARSVLVHFGEAREIAVATAEGIIETPRARGNTKDPAIYVVGHHFGTWLLKAQEGSPDEGTSVWYEFVDPTDEHQTLANRLGETLAGRGDTADPGRGENA